MQTPSTTTGGEAASETNTVINLGQIQVFDFNENAVRVILRDGEPWWVAADVCRVLALEQVTNAIRSLDEDEKMTLTIDKGQTGQRGGARFLNIISESGLYALIFKSEKPEAKSFRKWVTAEVLPALRRDGYYEVPELPPAPVVDVEEEEEGDDEPKRLRECNTARMSVFEFGPYDWPLEFRVALGQKAKSIALGVGVPNRRMPDEDWAAVYVWPEKVYDAAMSLMYDDPRWDYLFRPHLKPRQRRGRKDRSRKYSVNRL